MSDMTDTTDYIKIPEVLAVLPLRNIVVFPGMIVPLFVGRDKSIRALEDVMADDKQIMLVAQRDGDLDDPSEEDVYDIGTVGTILQLLKLPDGTVKVLVEGLRRAKLIDFVPNESFFQASVIGIEEEDLDSPDLASLSKTVVGQFDNYVKMNRKIPQEVQNVIREIDDPQKLADTVAGHLNIQISEKQALLENVSVAERLENVLGHMENEVGLLQVEKKIRGRVKRQMEKTQREYYLNEQLKAIQKELGEGEDGMDDLAELEAQIEKTKFSKEARDKAQAELKKLKNMSPMSAEATVVRNYLDWLLAVPWKKKSRVKKDLDNAEQVLESDHYGLEKVKERILEYLAVQNRTNKLKGPILCLVGPPGVGKTSLGKSLAKATGREFVRMSLGGVRDESEIRGHRRTYIGSMPGKIIQSMKKVKTSNPLILLDEIDKLGMDYRGDPASALLEVLDPEQNSTFNDHYLEVDYDLSNVMFVTTANTLNIPGPLLDRMEVISIPGYTEDEKVEIAKRHLLPKSIANHGLKKGEFELSNDALRQIIRTYTREAGVRNLERDLANVCRKTVTKIVRENISDVSVIPDNLEDFLGVSRYRFGIAEKEDQVGVVTGLAWTEVGGELLTIEGVMLPGKGKMTTTGKLGDVMKESIGAASSFVRSKSVDLGIEPPLFDKKDIHVHVPEGATPKDGPSAGIAMATAIVSLMTGIEVHKEVAMTGEVTLRGQVLPIGGLKEKLLAARRGGIERVIIPHENAKDLSEVPDNIKDGLDIIPVQSMTEVLEIALTRMPEAIEWDQTAYEAKQQSAMTSPQDTQRAH
ncbi:NADH-quinone oxidoreductase subunit I 1 protein [Candidatus Micropelagos thuwalensis]|uniref:Lon protease n=2 Tax=Candidatus Micropelagius thuwalensis TaxID=1397666 RepID=U2WCL9_9PROT|nr:endopeptidase La [Candidatus Micropelagos thuwalensis]ERL47259.1 NADH-quinone oxidoreductase subunit I 1 protein [Candidatus Micropelagos thuwalensis]